ncbi:hypothetical protein AVEN_64027-1 [Araneus ventricosus]|uniref:Uncharacterized protein n=1 Tax=Araneus ventricosus TaxID=182803 RepID=A0A4Y2LV50_ARAVE|nr:hypothetical protein AVEN_64027-1 [Araneus ventricosus]
MAEEHEWEKEGCEFYPLAVLLTSIISKTGRPRKATFTHKLELSRTSTSGALRSLRAIENAALSLYHELSTHECCRASLSPSLRAVSAMQ